MPDFALTSPSGDRYKVTVPDDHPEDAIHSTIADAIIPGLSEGDQAPKAAQEAREAATSRGIASTIRASADYGDVATARRQAQEYIQPIKDIPRDLYEHPENIVGTEGLGNVKLGIIGSSTRSAPQATRGILTQFADRIQQSIERDPRWRGWDEDRAWFHVNGLAPTLSDTEKEFIVNNLATRQPINGPSPAHARTQGLNDQQVEALRLEQRRQREDQLAHDLERDIQLALRFGGPASRSHGGLSDDQLQRIANYNTARQEGRITNEEFRDFRDAIINGTPEADVSAFRLDDRVRFPPPRPLGGSTRANQTFDNFIAPHLSEQDFANKYFAGMWSRSMRMNDDHMYAHGNGIEFNGPLFIKPGIIPGVQGRVGEMTRAIYPETGQVFHSYFSLNDNAQAAGLGKMIAKNQMEIYQQMGMKKISLSANIDVGAYAWAKYGYLPTPGSWAGLQRSLSNTLATLRMDDDVRKVAERALAVTDPSMIWVIADMRDLVIRGTISNKKIPLGKALLMGDVWKGELHLDNPEQMARFNEYISR